MALFLRVYEACDRKLLDTADIVTDGDFLLAKALDAQFIAPKFVAQDDYDCGHILQSGLG